MKIDLRTSAAPCALLVALLAAPLPALAETAEDTGTPRVNEAIVVTASKQDARTIGGAVQVLDAEDLAEFAYSDPIRVLRQVPGVNLQEEDGFGLRPNIGIRGSGTDRSARVALMEDGILIAPAPYAAPSAYYFPSIARMAGVEVSKGPAAIKYGPMTVGGAINFSSTPIPETPAGFVEALAGTDKARRAHGWAGGWTALGGGLEVGGLIEGLYDHSGGFKRIDRGGDTGHEVTDIVAKLGLRSTDGRHELQFKFQTYDETSAETYLGLTLDDFRDAPYRRYNASQRDRMDAEHQTYQLSYRFDPTDDLHLTLVGYRNDTRRSWYKLNDVRNTANTGWTAISNVLADPADYALQLADLAWAEGYTSRANALRVRDNNRRYQATGLQAVIDFSFATGSLGHELELSARYHEDEEDRFQHDDIYQIADGRMVLTSAGAPGSQSNRLGEAKAWAFYIRDTITAGSLTLTPGLRYETIDLQRTDWAGSDPERTAPTAISNSSVDVWIPGLAAAWEFSPGMRLVAGAHRGFASPAPGSAAHAETSWNYEAGVKLGRDNWHAEIIGYFNDYANLVGTCTNSTGGDCTIGDQFDGGKVHVKGVEVTGGYRFGDVENQGFAVPLSVVYTLTSAEFRSAFNSSYEPWGTVQKGDRLPYLPRHQLTLNAAVELESARLSASLNLVSKARAVAGTGAIPANEKVDARALVDIAGEVDLFGPLSLFGTVTNLFDKTYNVAFSPAGARPGAPRMAMAGVRARF